MEREPGNETLDTGLGTGSQADDDAVTPPTPPPATRATATALPGKPQIVGVAHAYMEDSESEMTSDGEFCSCLCFAMQVFQVSVNKHKTWGPMDLFPCSPPDDVSRASGDTLNDAASYPELDSDAALQMELQYREILKQKRGLDFAPDAGEAKPAPSHVKQRKVILPVDPKAQTGALNSSAPSSCKRNVVPNVWKEHSFCLLDKGRYPFHTTGVQCQTPKSCLIVCVS